MNTPHKFGARTKTVAFWSTPPLLSLLLYWPGLTSWFQKDDFAWLGLRDLVNNGRDFWWALFAPLAQGTIRTLSERVFFLSFSTLFGVHSLPFRCWAFLTFAASLAMLSAVCIRLTGSRTAGFWAAVVWAANGALAVPLSWTSVYYELLCSFFFLLSFWLLLRYVDTGDRRFYIAQCVTFGAGFGILELNVVYPALAAVLALCRARHVLGKILPLFVLSAAYTVLHIAVAPLPAAGPYRLHWDLAILSTLWTYWKWALGPSRLILLNIHPSVFRSALTVLLTVGLAGFLVSKLRQRQWTVAIFPAWFLIVLAPLLPLRDHIRSEYLTIPAIGLAMWGGWGCASGWRAGWLGKTVTLVMLVIYLGINIPLARVETQSFHDRSQEIKKLVLGVASLSRSQPGKLVLLKGVNTEMFWSAVYARPFRLFGIQQVYLVPEDEVNIPDDPQLGPARQFFLDPVLERKALDQDHAVVYDVQGGLVRDITAEYRASAQARQGTDLAAKVDVGNDLLKDQLGPTWYPNEGGFRWMPKRAIVMLRGPRDAGEKLYVTGSCPAAILKSGSLKMHVSIDGERLPEVWVRKPDAEFSFVFDLPAHLRGRAAVEVAVELERTLSTPADSRELGLAFGSFEIRLPFPPVQSNTPSRVLAHPLPDGAVK